MDVEERIAKIELNFESQRNTLKFYITYALQNIGYEESEEMGDKFIEEHDITFGGDFPINTGGGQLSAGQAGGAGSMLHVVEAVRQLKGESGTNQVKNAKTALVTGLGLLGYDILINVTSAMILQRR